MTDEISLSEFDARELLELAGPLEPHLDRLQLSYVDDRTILTVGFGADTTRSRRVATGRVAWLRRDGCWHHERRAMSNDSEICDPLHSGPTTAWSIDSVDDLYALFTWLKGDS